MNKPLPTEVTASALRDNLAAYLDAAERGATITITRRGRPSLQLAVVGETPEALDLDGPARVPDVAGRKRSSRAWSSLPGRTSGIRYYDTSAVLPLYLDEPATRAAHDALARDAGQLVTSVLTLIEVRSGLARYGREGVLSAAQIESCFWAGTARPGTHPPPARAHP